MSWPIYRWLWWVVLSAGIAHGLLVSLERLALPEVVLIGGGMAAQGVVSGWLVWGGDSRPQRIQVLAAGLVCAVLTLAVVGVVLAHGWAGIVAAGGICLGGLVLRWQLRRSAGVPGDRRAAVPAPVGQPGADWMKHLSTAELCRAWESTTAALPRLGVTTRHEAFVRLRVEYLDELERRDPPAFHRWLSEGWADADPSTFFAAAADP